MHVIKVRNVNQALHEGLWYLKTCGGPAESRNGPVLVAPGPVATIYTHPMERVLFHPVRDANPVFHLLETIWMFSGRRDVGWLLPFNSQYGNYAEESGIVHGAYGYRWRQTFGFDQLAAIAKELKDNPTSRRAVLSMWGAVEDLGENKRDLPCNTHAYFSINAGRLNMTVCNRSNDVIWGAYGANAVHFSMLLELMAKWIGVEVGQYTQFSNNFHVYTENEVAQRLLPAIEADAQNPYRLPEPTPMFTPTETVSDFLDDCDSLTGPEPHDVPYNTQFFRDVVYPLMDAYIRRKVGGAFSLKFRRPCDWTLAFQEWVERRYVKEAK